MKQTSVSTSVRTALIAGALSVTGGAAVVGLSPLVSDGPGVAVAQVDDGTPASFVPISQYRTFDSRLVDDGSKIFLQEQYDIDPNQDLDGMDRLPDDAIAVSYNITVAGTERSGFVQILGPDTTFGSTSTINWSEDGQRLANSGNVELGAFQEFYMFLDGAPFAAAHVIIDVTGYYEIGRASCRDRVFAVV